MLPNKAIPAAPRNNADVPDFLISSVIISCFLILCLQTMREPIKQLHW